MSLFLRRRSQILRRVPAMKIVDTYCYPACLLDLTISRYAVKRYRRASLTVRDGARELIAM